jgi:hypothetical protein
MSVPARIASRDPYLHSLLSEVTSAEDELSTLSIRKVELDRDLTPLLRQLYARAREIGSSDQELVALLENSRQPDGVQQTLPFNVGAMRMARAEVAPRPIIEEQSMGADQPLVLNPIHVDDAALLVRAFLREQRKS